MKTPAKSKTKKTEGTAKSSPTKPDTQQETDARQTVLLSVIGQSPAVLTETVWALADEKPAITPHRVVVLTTTKGREALIRDLFKPEESCVWDQMCAALQAKGHNVSGRLKFGQTADDIRVFTRFDPVSKRNIELPDITNEEENLAAADFIMEQVRGLAADNVRLVASVAGGRKTMGALLFAVMSLIGRRDDVLTHVLVNEPFESPGLKPRFYFPVTPVETHTLTDPAGNPVRDREGKPVTPRTDEARILLGRIPFVALRTLFERDVIESPTYSVLVQRCQVRSEDYARMNVRLRIHRSRLLIDVNDHEIQTSIPQHLYLMFLAERAIRQEPSLPQYFRAYLDFNEFCNRIKGRADAENWGDWRHEEVPTHDAESFERFCVKAKNELKAKLERAGPKAALLYPLLPAAGRFSLYLPPSQITIVS